MKSYLNAIMASVIFASCGSAVYAQSEENPFAKLNWKKGPTTAKVGSVARQNVGEGYSFLESYDARKFLELNQNPTSSADVGIIVPDDMTWFAAYSYDDIGYVRDDEKDSLDKDAMLNAFKENSKRSNAERRKKGWPELTPVGWAQAPHYDEVTHNLEWALKLVSEGQTVVNYNTRFLGRGGVMRVILVCDPDDMMTVLPQFKAALKGFEYTEGHRYLEYRSGDRAAEIGLSALVVGGATAVAVKSGAFKWIWKVLVFVAVAVGGFFKKLFGRGGSDK